MAVYLVVHLSITDRDLYREYCRAAPPIIRKFGGRYLANTGEITTIAGDWQPEKTVILEFGSLQTLTECFHSVEYGAIAPKREQSTTGHAFIINGLAG